MRKLLWLLPLLALLVLPRAATAAAAKVNIILVSPPGESWTAEEQTRAVGAVLDATAWWSRNSKVAVPSFELGWTTTITPTDFSYALFTWERPYYSYPPSSLTVFIIDNSSSRKTMGGALGWSQTPCQVITALLGSGRDELAFVVAHEYGHAVLDLNYGTAARPREHTAVGAFDIMAPSPSQETYTTGTIGFYTRRAMGEAFQMAYLSLVAK